jgi:hypothetical protein
MAMRPGTPGDGDPADETAPAAPIASAQWHVDRVMFAAKAIGAVAFGLIPPVLGLNAASRWFGLVVAIGLAIYAVRDLVAPVRLSADSEGVTVIHGYAGHRRLRWSEIERVRVDAHRRGEFLELDAGESLHLLSRYDLGARPTEVLETLEKIREGH